jgi:endonuclease/exonuclease/phosphatase family metal-dependent hydrolase
MTVSLGTFNLNNLFSRFNFQAELDGIPPSQAGGIEITFQPDAVRARTFLGRLVKRKEPEATAMIAQRIQALNIDVLAVQEVEHVEILREFNRENLSGLYPHVALVEGNDPRMIDVGVLSKLPIGAITSHQTAEHPDRPGERAFGRDLIEVEIRDAAGNLLLTLWNTHLKSHFVPHTEDPVQGAIDANARRRRQADTIRRIVSARQAKGSRFAIVGDMNDPPSSANIAPMLKIDGISLVNGLANAVETRPAKPETPGQGPGPLTPQWTHRFNPAGPGFPHYELFDHVWLSKALGDRLVSAHIDRRTRHGGDGSDHDPAWVVLDI